MSATTSLGKFLALMVAAIVGVSIGLIVVLVFLEFTSTVLIAIGVVIANNLLKEKP